MPEPGTAAAAEVPDWHALDEAAAVRAVASDAARGLTDAEAHARRARVGPNVLREAPRRTTLAVLVGQVRSPLIYLLFGAAALALALGHVTDAIVIAVVVVLNAVIGAVQEGRAERSLAALRRLSTLQARLVRDGREVVVPARDVVPGDVLVLEAGDAVPADARVLESTALQLAEAALTGESLPVAKDRARVAPDTPLADRHDMVYAGTLVTAGRARAVVVATGAATEIGHIAALAETAAEPATPLERRIAQFGRYLALAALGVFGLIIAIGLARGVPLGEILMVGISQVVGMVPEGLPVAMTIALAVGVQRMARRRAVIRRLAAVETLGATTVICTDKTGTLTRNEMTVTAVYLASGRWLEVTGVGYAPDGELVEAGRAIAPAADAELRALLEAVAACNDAQLDAGGDGGGEPRWLAIGDPTEVALLTLARKGGVDPAELRARAPRRAEIPFDPAARMMATEHATPAGPRVIIKGAPEAVLELCGERAAGDRFDPDALRRAAERMAGDALRVLAVAAIDASAIARDAGFAGLRGHPALTVLGLVGQHDPPRAEVEDAIARCRAAGIHTVMVTGDHKATAEAIARQLGITGGAVDGRELERMPDAELAARIDDISVFARVRPAQKLRIVEAFQRRGDVVAMTGDGVNDAPALAQADIGVAMGITGTEVAKNTAKVVIADDNFATIVAAVEEGRVVYHNIKKALLLLFSTSAAEVLVLAIAMTIGYPPPFAAVQILWNNLVTEGLITVNLAMEPAEGDEMTRRPIPRREPLLTRVLLARMAFIVPAIVIVTLGWFAYRTAEGVPPAQVRTETFTLLAICEWYNVLNCRSERASALSLDVLRNHWLIGGLVVGNLLQVAVVFWAPLNAVFYTTPFELEIVLALGVVGSLVLWVEELRKLIVRRRAVG